MEKKILKTGMLLAILGIGVVGFSSIDKKQTINHEQQENFINTKSINKEKWSLLAPQGSDVLYQPTMVTTNSATFYAPSLEDNYVNNIIIQNSEERLIYDTFKDKDTFSIQGLSEGTDYEVYVWYYDSELKTPLSTNIVEFTTEGEALVPTYNVDKTYQQGDQVKYEGITWTAKWYINKGQQPTTLEPSGINSGWEISDGTIVEWSNEGTYAANDIVFYNGTKYQAKYWNSHENVTPDQSSAWEVYV